MTKTGALSFSSSTLTVMDVSVMCAMSDAWTRSVYCCCFSWSNGCASVILPLNRSMLNMRLGLPPSAKSYVSVGFVSTSLAVMVVMTVPTSEPERWNKTKHNIKLKSSWGASYSLTYLR